MNKAKKFLVGLLAFASVSAFALGVVACKDDGTDSGDLPPEQQNAIEQVYDSYVEYATAQGQTPLDYETWLATIKGATGAKGDKGDKGETGVGIESIQVDEDGMMIITLTDGTVLPAIELPTGEPIEKGATRNLHYQKIAGKDEYRVIGLGLAAENDIVISSTYNGLPVTEIGDNAFYGETYITSVEIPDSITTIGGDAFERCDSLETVYYTGDIASWCGILGLNSIASSKAGIHPKYLYIDNALVVGNLVIPDGVETINDYAFYGTKVESVTIPDSVTTIGYEAFSDCDSLTSITIPNSVTTIGTKAFSNCDNLTYNIKDNVKYLGNENNPYIYLVGMVDEAATSVTIDNTCKFIGSSAFSDCDGLTSVTIPDSVTTIGDSAFYGCSKLTSVTIPDSVTTIGSIAFYNCDNLTNIMIGNSVTTIGRNAFYGCWSLTSVVFEDTSTWYRTNNYEDWQNKVNGTLVDVSDAETVADLLTDEYYCWYKL